MCGDSWHGTDCPYGPGLTEYSCPGTDLRLEDPRIFLRNIEYKHHFAFRWTHVDGTAIRQSDVFRSAEHRLVKIVPVVDALHCWLDNIAKVQRLRLFHWAAISGCTGTWFCRWLSEKGRLRCDSVIETAKVSNLYMFPLGISECYIWSIVSRRTSPQTVMVRIMSSCNSPVDVSCNASELARTPCRGERSSWLTDEMKSIFSRSAVETSNLDFSDMMQLVNAAR